MGEKKKQNTMKSTRLFYLFIYILFTFSHFTIFFISFCNKQEGVGWIEFLKTLNTTITFKTSAAQALLLEDYPQFCVFYKRYTRHTDAGAGGSCACGMIVCSLAHFLPDCC